jgi:hypothetical protein
MSGSSNIGSRPWNVSYASSGQAEHEKDEEIGRLQLQVNKLKRHKQWYKERWHRSEQHMIESREEILYLRHQSARLNILKDTLTAQAKAEAERAAEFFRKYWDTKHRLHEFIQQRDSIDNSS